MIDMHRRHGRRQTRTEFYQRVKQNGGVEPAAERDEVACRVGESGQLPQQGFGGEAPTTRNRALSRCP